MQESSKIKEYCSLVCDQIRWKKARPIVEREIENHIYDQSEAYILEGFSEEEATKQAILQMGDPIAIGEEFDKTHKPRPQWTMIVLVGAFMLLGMFTNYLIDSSGLSIRGFNLMTYALAFWVFIVCYYIDFTFLGKFALAIYLLILGFSVIGVVLGTLVNGRLTLSLMGFSLSLSHLSLIFPLSLALLVYVMKDKGYFGIFICGIGAIPLGLVLLKIPTLVGLIVFTISVVGILVFAIYRNWFKTDIKNGLALVLIPGALILAVLTALSLHNLSVVIDPYQDKMGEGYIYYLIREFISGSSLIGTGSVPEGIKNISSLPEISTNYALVYLIHRFGFIVLIGIVSIVAIFTAIGLYNIAKQKNTLGALVALSIMLPFILQTIFYMISNLGYSLTSTLSMPFISYGNFALLINSALIGFMLSVFRTGYIYSDNSLLFRNQKYFSYEKGKLIINIKK
ncbi:MAG: permease prefix domain 1-containing protein [Peptostreptococcaceae bacterium]